MASLGDIILQQAQKSIGNVEVPANLKNQVISGLSESILGSLTQTAAKAGGIDMVKQLLTGKTSAASSPITQLAGNLFTNNILKNLNLGSALNGTLSGLVPTIMSKLSGVLKDQDGDGDVDLNDILMSLKGGSSAKASILGAATSILGGIFKK